MEEWRGRSLLMPGPMVGVFAEDRRVSQRLAPRARQMDRGLFLDLLDEMDGPASPGLLGQVLPAGEGREAERLGSGVLETIEFFSAVAGGVLLSAVEPDAGRVLALEERLGDVDSRPVLGRATRPSLQPFARR
jgi:hypothetical protein